MGSCRGITPCKKKKKQLLPQLPMSNGNFLSAEIYLSHTGSNGMQLCIAALGVHTGLLLTGRVYPIRESIRPRLCGGGGIESTFNMLKAQYSVLFLKE